MEVTLRHSCSGVTTAGLENISISGSRRKMRVFIIGDVSSSRMVLGLEQSWVLAPIVGGCPYLIPGLLQGNSGGCSAIGRCAEMANCEPYMQAPGPKTRLG